MKIAEHVSPPFSEYIKVILKISYNRGADLLVCLAAAKAGSRDCTAGLGRTYFLSRPASPDRHLFFDGAGTDDNSKTTPADETQAFC